MSADTDKDINNIPGNFYDKYHTHNPIARAIMKNFLQCFHELVSITGAKTAYEFGCGEGELSISLASRGLTVSGSDLEPTIVEVARANALAATLDCAFTVHSVYDGVPEPIDAELIVCCEVLEHLTDPQTALDQIAHTEAEFFIFSVPREPLWRTLNIVRGQYVADLGNTPGHLQHWSTRGFIELVESRFKIEVVRKPIPWSMLLCRPL